MQRFLHTSARKTSLPPGSVVHIGERRTEQTRIRILAYHEEAFTEKEAVTVEDCLQLKDATGTAWISIEGLHDTRLIEKLGSGFGVHPLVLEDVVNTTQRTKFEDYNDYIYFVMKMLVFDQNHRVFKLEQLSLIVSGNVILTFQEQSSGLFEPLRERIRNGMIRSRKRKADYIAYALLDCVVDNYLIALEKFGDEIEKFEENVLQYSPRTTPQTIILFKRELLALQRVIWPLREALDDFKDSDSQVLENNTRLYLKDVFDHVLQAGEEVESYRDTISGLAETYHSALSHRMNEIMKVLTMIATLFIPLTFFAGIYGMNFEHMPELRWIWAYPLGFWVLILGISVFTFWFFKHKKWL